MKLSLPGVARRHPHRYLAAGPIHPEARTTKAQTKAIRRLKERYVRGDLTLAEFDAALDALLHPPVEAPAKGALFRRKLPVGTALRVAAGAAASVALAGGYLLATGLLTPAARRPRRTPPGDAQMLFLEIVVIEHAAWRTRLR